MTLQEFWQTILSDLGKRSHTQYETDAKKWANWAYKKVASDKRLLRAGFFPALEDTVTRSTTASTAYVSAPNYDDDGYYYHCVLDVKDSTNDNVLEQKDYDYILNQAESEGTPLEWALWSNKIYLYPTPDADISLSIRAIKEVSNLQNEDDETLLGKEWDDVLIMLGTARGHRALGNYQDYHILMKYAEQEMAKIISNSDLGNRTITVGWRKN